MNSEKYKSLCRELDLISQKENPCRFVNGICFMSRECWLTEFNTCCRRCRHLGENGCTETILGCKLWFCLLAWGNLSRGSRKTIENIRKSAMVLGFHGIIGEKEI
jgi:hypothetical protein